MSQKKNELSRREFVKITGAATAGLALTACGLGRGRKADLVLLDGNIITVDSKDSIVQAVAARNGEIVRVGSNNDVQDLISDDTEVLNLEGKTVTPGLVDSHIHVMYFGKQEWEGFTEIRIPDVSSKEDLLQVVAEAASQIPEGEWVSGNQGFLLPLAEAPTLQELDAAAPNHPVYLKHMSGQYGVVNSLAMELAEINKDTPNPPGGVVVKNPETGEPTGFLNHYSAQNLVGRIAPGWGTRTEEELAEDVKRGQDLVLAAGYTSGQDVIVGSSRDIGIYRQVAKEDGLKMRMYLMQFVPSAKVAKDEIEKAESFEVGLCKFGGWKLAVDGGGSAATSLMYDTNLLMSNRSYPYYKQETMNLMVNRYHQEGYQVSFHCSGDRAIDMAINAIDYALKEKPDANHRHKIEHALFPTKESLQRIADLGIHVSTQPQWISLLGDAYKHVGSDEVMSRFMPLKTMLDMGITLSFGCDVPATPVLEPNWAFAGAYTRTTFNDNIYNEEEALTMQEALRIHTMGSAYASFEEDEKGSIEVGKFADMVVWSNNLYTLDPWNDLKDFKAETTIVGGEVV
jgi:predicted amidohydrolase YtcJ